VKICTRTRRYWTSHWLLRRNVCFWLLSQNPAPSRSRWCDSSHENASHSSIISYRPVERSQCNPLWRIQKKQHMWLLEYLVPITRSLSSSQHMEDHWQSWKRSEQRSGDHSSRFPWTAIQEAGASFHSTTAVEASQPPQKYHRWSQIQGRHPEGTRALHSVEVNQKWHLKSVKFLTEEWVHLCCVCMSDAKLYKHANKNINWRCYFVW